jgi:NAD(P)-dependent dehydrogenase (short-subunit alcohol dehydrogenase family)
MTRDLSTLSVAVTGGARGIGEATAALLVAAGARVTIGDTDAELGAATARALGAGFHPLDVTDTDSWRAFVDAAGPLDVLVNNAGIMPLGDLLKEPDEVTRRIFEVNTLGVIWGTKAVAPGMVDRGRGHIVNVASAVGRVAAAGGATYSASKHAVVGLTEATRQELAGSGIDVSMVLPAIVSTELSAGVPATRGVPTITPGQVAEVIVDVIRKPVAEAWVPRWTQPMAKVTMALPRRVQEGMARAFGADKALADVDAVARSAYEARVRPPDASHP